MQEHYCDKCFRLIKIGTEHQDWCPLKPELDADDLKGTPFEDLMNGINKQ